MTRISDTLNARVRDEHQLVVLMTRAAELAVGEISGVDHAGMTVSFGGRPFTVAPTDAAVLEIDAQQYRTGDGPCLRAMRTDRWVSMTDTEVMRLWPELGEASRQAGVQEFLAAPLHDDDGPVGSLNMYAHRPNSRMADSADVITVLSDYVDRGISQFRHVLSRESTATALQRAVQERRTVDHALGILMERRQCSRDEARRELDSLANIYSRNVSHAATVIVEGHEAEPPDR